MVGKVAFGVSIYPDFYNKDECKEMLDQAKKLGYQRVFTSIQLGDLGFDQTKDEITDDFKFLFSYAAEIGMVLHVDINDRMLKRIGATVDNLKPLADWNIPIIRLDGGFSVQEIAEMTNNTFGIIIEENLSNYSELKKRLEMVKEIGNLKQYYGCHNFFPRCDTGIILEDAIKVARMYQDEGCKTGIFIGSLYADKDLNQMGRGVVTVEKHRYLPAKIQAMELLAYDSFDYIIFGDSNPRLDELKEVISSYQTLDDVITPQQREVWKKHLDQQRLNTLCIDIPVYWDNLDADTISILESIVFLNRNDIAEKVIRGTQSRDIFQLAPNLPIKRTKYSITIDNTKSNRYCGELQIMLEDLESVEYVNFVGVVKPYATDLLAIIQKETIFFRLRGEKQ